jgi:uncharacterized protein (TIGR02118 family)
MPGATVLVLYPKTESSTFDFDYYKATHMNLVDKAWSKIGLKSWTVIKFGDDAPYSYGASLVWESLEAFGKAAQDPASKEVMDDIDNFSNVKPTLLPGNILLSS